MRGELGLSVSHAQEIEGKERKGKERGGKGAVGGVLLRISFSFSFFWLGATDSIHYCRCLWLISDLSSLSSRRNAEICRWDGEDIPAAIVPLPILNQRIPE